MRGERSGDLRVASFSLPSHPGPVERVSTSFSGSGWCGSGAVEAVGGLPLWWSLLHQGAKLASSLDHRMSPGQLPSSSQPSQEGSHANRDQNPRLFYTRGTETSANSLSSHLQTKTFFFSGSLDYRLH